jgi:hypothetical protein
MTDIVLVSDGTLTRDDASRLSDAIPGASFLSSEELSSQIEAKIKDYPFCRKYRQWCPWAKKIIDIPLHADSDFIFVDGDILFMRDFELISSGDIEQFGIIAMKSYANIYSFGFKNALLRSPVFPIVAKVNSGFMFVRRGAYSLEVVERFLHDAEGHARPALWEQTAWGVVAGCGKSAYFDSRQVTFPQVAMSPQKQLKWLPVALHFVGGTRHLIPEVLSLIKELEEDPPAENLRVEGALQLNSGRLAMDIWRHRALIRRCRKVGILQ